MRDGFYSRLFVISAFCSKYTAFYLKRDYGLENSLALHAMTKKRHSERKARKNPFPFYEKGRIAAHLSALAMTWREGKRIAVHLMAFAMAKRLVILSAKRERIRNTLKRVTDYSRLPIR